MFINCWWHICHEQDFYYTQYPHINNITNPPIPMNIIQNRDDFSSILSFILFFLLRLLTLAIVKPPFIISHTPFIISHKVGEKRPLRVCLYFLLLTFSVFPATSSSLSAISTFLSDGFWWTYLLILLWFALEPSLFVFP